jgi:hypothetical protein
MDRAKLQQRLQDIGERLIARGECNITYQRGMIETLKRGEHDASIAEMFLRRLESMQARDIANRDRLLKELSSPS